MSSSPEPYLFPEGARIGMDNAVLSARAKRHRVTGFAGPLSVKTVVSGRVAWIVGGRELVVDESSFLILGEGEVYSMNIDAEQPVETCCVFFAPGFVERVVLDATSPLENSLNEPDRIAPSLPYISALHGDEERVLTGRVHTLARRCKGALNPSGYEEDFLLASESLLRFSERIRAEAARLPAIRESTRQELFRRLLRAREYIHSNASEPISLAHVARAACLSPFHFHRGFTRAFRQTPHEYLTALRLDQARKKIESGSPITDAALGAGFMSPSAFSRLFRRRYHEPPSAVRRKFARSGEK